jgi:hypothetical protein
MFKRLLKGYENCNRKNRLLGHSTYKIDYNV